MLNWAVTFFIIAIVAAIFGFSGIAGAASGIAQMLFVLFVVCHFLGCASSWWKDAARIEQCLNSRIFRSQ